MPIGWAGHFLGWTSAELVLVLPEYGMGWACGGLAIIWVFAIVFHAMVWAESWTVLTMFMAGQNQGCQGLGWPFSWLDIAWAGCVLPMVWAAHGPLWPMARLGHCLD
jgi:hypothetical protein